MAGLIPGVGSAGAALGAVGVPNVAAPPALQVAPGPAPGGVDWLGGRLWIQRAAGPRRPGPAPRAAAPRPLVALAPAVAAGAPPFPDWCSDGALREAAALKAGMPQLAPGGWQAWAGFVDAAGAPKMPEWAGRGIAAMPFGIDSLVITIARLPFRVADWVTGFLPRMAGCSIASARTIGVWSFAIGWLNRLTQDGFLPIKRGIQYMSNYNCPYELISGEDAAQLTARCQLSYNEGEEWAAVNGWCKTTWQWRYWLAQTRIGVSELIDLFHRGKPLANLPARCPGGAPGAAGGPIGPPRQQLVQALINTGVADAANANAMIDLSYQRLDRATILEALNRLRPGRDPSGISYTTQDAQTDLTALGYQQRDIQILLALNRHPPNFRQLQKPYFDGLMQLSDLQEFQRDDGLSERGIEQLAPYLQFEQKLTLREQTGAPAPPALVKELAAGIVQPGEYDAEMSARGYQQSTISAGHQEAQAQRGRDVRTACIAGVRAQLKTGQTSPAQAAIALAECGVDSAIAGELIVEWAIERANGAKPASLGDLCTWVAQGWITVPEYATRLSAMGYSAEDVKRVINTCGLKQRQRQEAARAKAAKVTAAEIKARIQAARAKAAAGKSELAGMERDIKHDIGGAKSVAASVKARAKVDISGPPAPKPTPETAPSVVSGATAPSTETPQEPYTSPPYAAQYLPGAAIVQPPNTAGQGTIPVEQLPPSSDQNTPASGP